MKSPLWYAFCTSWFANVTELLGLGGRGDHQVHREVAAARQRRRHQRDHADPGDLREPAAASIWSCCAVRFRSLHGFVTMPPKPPVGTVSWNVFLYSGNER
jgi:hypothetical protein